MVKAPRASHKFLIVAGALSVLTLGAAALQAGSPPPDYRKLVLAAKPVAYWRLGEQRGPVALDATKHGHDGKYQGAPIFGELGALRREPDRAVKLPGNRSYIEIPASKAFSQPSSGQGLTVEVWMRPDTLVFPGETKDPYVLWLGKGSAGQQEWGLRFYSKNSTRPNRISAYIWNPEGSLGSGAYFEDALMAKEWIHVVACYDPGNYRTNPKAGVSIFKNGVLRGGPATQPGSLYSAYKIMPAAGAAPLRLGTRDLKSFLTGGLDEVAIYPRVLSPAEVLSHYRAGAGK